MMMFHRPMLMVGLGWFVLGAAQAYDVTYKCPNHVYSNTISAKEAKDKGCTVLDNAPITVIQSNKPRPAARTGRGSGYARLTKLCYLSAEALFPSVRILLPACRPVVNSSFRSAISLTIAF